MASFDTASFLTAVKVRAAIPSNSAQVLSDAQILQMADQESLPVVALLKSVRENYFQTSNSQDLVSGQAAYRIPSRAVGAAIHQAIYIDSGGTEFPLNPIGAADVPRWRTTTTEQGTPHSYYLDQANVILVPAPNVTGTLKMVSVSYTHLTLPTNREV